MRVGLLTTSFPLPGSPVSGVFVARLADHLSRAVSLTVLTPAGVSALPPPPGAVYTLQCFRYAPRRWQLIAHRPGGIPVALRRRRWLLLLLPAFLLGMFLACWRLARRVDVLHANWTATGAIAGIAGKLTGTPVVTTLRGSDVERLERSRLDRALLGLCARTNASLVCVSEAIARQVAARLPGARNKLSVIPNGVDDHFLAIPRATDDAGSKTLELLVVGSLIPRKAVHLAVEALSLIADTSTAELSIVGDGPERGRLAALIQQRRLSDRVRLTGELAPPQIVPLLAKAGALLLTSRFEGRPNVVLEAMAAGLPVIASRIPGVTELVRDGVSGLLFEPGDAEALADCIRRLEGDPELRGRLGEAGRRFIREHRLEWQETARSYIEVYTAALQTAAG